MSATNNQDAISRAAIIALPALVVYSMELFEVLGASISFIALTTLLQVYLVREAMAIRSRHPQRWMLNPAVFCALLTFTLGYGITNLLFFASEDVRRALALDVEISPAMVKLLFLALIAAIAMFLGYWSTIADSITDERSAGRFHRFALRGLDVPRVAPILILVAVSTIVRIYAIQIGLFGYGGNYSSERLAETSSFSQYISMASGGGMLALTLSALSFYRQGKNGTTTALLATTITTELIFGLLSGMKAAIVMPFLVPVICSYMARGKMSSMWLGLTVVAFFLSYLIVEPFRAARNDESGALTSSSAIVQVLMTDSVDQSRAAGIGIGWRILARGNISHIGSLGIEYADSNDELSSTAPAFLADLFLAPAHAVVPRAIWKTKPLGELGFWYTQEVMGMQLNSSTGMGPLTYLYFAGGFIAVAVFFFLLGILQRWIWFMLRPWASVSGAVIFLSLLTTISMIDSGANGVLINLMRTSPIILILARLLFRSAQEPEQTSLRPKLV
jgi:hypothetical protein